MMRMLPSIVALLCLRPDVIDGATSPTSPSVSNSNYNGSKAHLYAAASLPKVPAGTELRIGKRNETIKEFVERLFSGYNGNIPPSTYDGKVTTVRVGVYVLDFGSLDLVNMDYSVTMFLRQIWHDPRLAYQDYDKPLALNYMRPRMWVPDLYFINEKQSRMHELTTPNLLMRLYPDGKIVYSQKVTVQLWCLMDLRRFPLDTQECEMKMESYGYTTEEVMLDWVNGTGNALQFAHKQLSEYELLAEFAGHCTEKYLTGAYSCLNVTFHMERKFGYYLIQTYIPTVLIVILSWVSFWIDVNAVPARISVGLLTVLSMTTQSSGMRAQLPRVSYVKAIDVWQSVSLIFVFGALIEFAIANFSQRLRDRADCVKPEYDKDGTRRRRVALPRRSVAQLCDDEDQKSVTRKPKQTRRPSSSNVVEYRAVPSNVTRFADTAFGDAETSFLLRRHPGETSRKSLVLSDDTGNDGDQGHWNAGMSPMPIRVNNGNVNGSLMPPTGRHVISNSLCSSDGSSNGSPRQSCNALTDVVNALRVDTRSDWYSPLHSTPTQLSGVVITAPAAHLAAPITPPMTAQLATPMMTPTADTDAGAGADVEINIDAAGADAHAVVANGKRNLGLRRLSIKTIQLMDPDKIDALARIIFPFAFFLFNLLYWTYYLWV